MSKRPRARQASTAHRNPAAKPLLSVCMIVRDEEANIGRALQSISGVADEVIVVDTGSSDRTAAIAGEAGARVVLFAWADDFAAARNESLRHATGEWILYIDADEELVEPHSEALRQLIASLAKHELGALIEIDNPVDQAGQNSVVGQQWRLFRNGAGIHFEGRIHEQLRWPDGEPNLRPAHSHGVRLLHHGYVDDGQLLARKGERNRRLLELSLAEHPNEPAYHFFLGRQYVWEGRFEEALAPLLKGIELWKLSPHGGGYVPSLFSTAALAALRGSKPEAAVEIERNTPAEHLSAELLYAAGVAYARLGQTDEAIARLNRAWQDTELARASGSDPSASTWRPLLALAEIHESLGRTDDAREMAHKGLSLSPGRPELEAFLSRLEGGDVLVSACMIVRDEEQNLRRWLPSVRAAVDELIVVDTGSEDRTAELAAELGARVSTFAWCDDFAAARNASLAQARGQWIVWLDADDELLLDTPDALRQVCRSLPATVDGAWIDVHSTTNPDGAMGASLRQWRLFRKGRGFAFRGRIHEQLAAPDARAINLAEVSGVHVRHWGYATESSMQEKLARNRRLLELSMAEQPAEPLHHYSLGKQLVWEKNNPAALEELEKALELWRSAGHPNFAFLGPLFSVAACAAINVGHNERALQLEDECPVEAVSSDLLYYAAIACQRLGRLEDAKARLLRAATDPAVRGATETDAATATWRPRLLLGEIAAAQGNREGAFRWVMEAVDLMPDEHPEVLLSAARLARTMHSEADAVRICQRLIASAAPDAIQAEATRLLAGIEAAASVGA